MDALGLPKVLKGKSLDSMVGYEQEKQVAIDALNAGKHIFINGPCGTGKSHLAYGLLARWWEINRFISDEEISTLPTPIRLYASKTCRFLPAVELLHELRSSFAVDSTVSEDELISRYTRDDLLVIDDIGAEKISEWSRSVFYLLVDRRYRDKRQTIFTSNLTLETIAILLDDRIASRLATCEVIELKGLDGQGADWRVSHAE